MYYSQFQEDEFIVKYCERYKIQLHPVAIEIGASNGITNSNIRHFGTEKEFRCIYVEPHPERFKELLNNTKGQSAICINAACIKITRGIGRKVGFKIEQCPDFSHLDQTSDFFVESITFAEILDQYIEKRGIGILSIDTEGFEMPILSDALKGSIRPQFIIVESNATYERIKQIKLLIENGYVLHKMKDKNMLWMNGDLMTSEQDNAIYDVR
jgi:FkbM family methyltransferase